MQEWPEWQDPEEYNPTHRYCGVCDALVVIQEHMFWPEEHNETKHIVVEMEPPPGAPLGEVLRFCKRMFGLRLSQSLLAMGGIQGAATVEGKRHRIMCRSCEQYWWDDEECLCTCTDDQELPYEDWVVVDILD